MKIFKLNKESEIIKNLKEHKLEYLSYTMRKIYGIRKQK